MSNLAFILFLFFSFGMGGLATLLGIPMIVSLGGALLLYGICESIARYYSKRYSEDY